MPKCGSHENQEKGANIFLNNNQMVEQCNNVNFGAEASKRKPRDHHHPGVPV